MSVVLDLKELLRSKGKTQSEAGVTQMYVSMLANGHRRAGAGAITRMAIALGCTTDEVFAACEESRRRAQAEPPTPPAPKPDLSAGLAALGDPPAVDHPTAAPSAQEA